MEEEAERARLLLLLPLAPLPLPRMKEACVTTRRWRRTPGAIAKSRLELDAIARVALALAPAAVLPTEFFLPALRVRGRRGVSERRVDVCHKSSLGKASCGLSTSCWLCCLGLTS